MWREHPSESDKLIIDTIGVTNISIQSFTKLVGIGSKSDDLHGADRTRRHTLLSVAWVRLWRISLVLGGVNTFEHEPEGKEDRMMEILFMKKELKVFANAAKEEWSGRYILGQRPGSVYPCSLCWQHKKYRFPVKIVFYGTISLLAYRNRAKWSYLQHVLCRHACFDFISIFHTSPGCHRHHPLILQHKQICEQRDDTPSGFQVPCSCLAVLITAIHFCLGLQKLTSPSSIEQHDLWTRYSSPPLCWWQPAICIGGLCSSTERFIVMFGLCPVMDVDQ